MKNSPAFDLATHPKAFCKVPDLANYLDCNRRTIVDMIDNGSLAAVRVGRQWRVATDSARRAFHVPQHEHVDTSGESRSTDVTE